MKFMAQHRDGEILSLTSTPDGAPSAAVVSDGGQVAKVEIPDGIVRRLEESGENAAAVLREMRIEETAEVREMGRAVE